MRDGDGREGEGDRRSVIAQLETSAECPEVSNSHKGVNLTTILIQLYSFHHIHTLSLVSLSMPVVSLICLLSAPRVARGLHQETHVGFEISPSPPMCDGTLHPNVFSFPVFFDPLFLLLDVIHRYVQTKKTL